MKLLFRACEELLNLFPITSERYIVPGHDLERAFQCMTLDAFKRCRLLPNGLVALHALLVISIQEIRSSENCLSEWTVAVTRSA